MLSKRTIAVAATSLAGLAGCGTQNATDSAQTQAAKATDQAAQAEQSLSPQAKGVLARAQSLAGDVTQTAKAYATQDITQQQALSRLEGYRQRASGLTQQAQGLPESGKARAQVGRLNRTLERLTAAVKDRKGPAAQRIGQALSALGA